MRNPSRTASEHPGRAPRCWWAALLATALSAGCKRDAARDGESDISAIPEAAFSAQALPAREPLRDGAALFAEVGAGSHGVVLGAGEAGGSVEVVDADGDGRPDLRFGGGAVFLQSDRAWEFVPGGAEPAPVLAHATATAGAGFEETARGLRLESADVPLASVAWPCGRGGFALADFDRDGLDDVICAGDAHTTHYRRMTRADGAAGRPNQLLWNRGGGVFHEVAWIAGLARAGDVAAVVCADFDSDGWPDVFFANGTSAVPERDLAFGGGEGLSFDERGADWGVDHEGASTAAAAGDLDGDGDLDLVVARADGAVSLFRNGASAASGARRVVVRLVGEPGAQVEVETADGVQTQIAAAGAEVLFGIGGADIVRRLEVAWPDGRRQRFVDLAPDHRFRIDQEYATGGPAAAEVAENPPPAARFGPPMELPVGQGAFVVLVDFDNDADADLFVGGAGAAADTLWRNDGAGGFAAVECAALGADAASASTAAAFFDADGDRDLDLYVASGGDDVRFSDNRLLDRLYLGDGKGGFVAAHPEALPDLRDSGSCLAVADIDADGDLDLFAGGGASPDGYPEPSFSRLLVNLTPAGGPVRFAEAAADARPDLHEAGLVRAATWVDFDGDGDTDLVCAVEWGPLRVFENLGGGAFAEATERVAPGGEKGWWTSVVPGDFDGDGDLDFAAGNRGLNSVYRAAPREPALFGYSRQTRSGQPGFYEEGRVFPFQSRDEAVAADPALAERFPTAHDYAGATLEELRGESWAEDALWLQADTLESGLWVSSGGTFEFRPFPAVAQLAEVAGMVSLDIDGDGAPDLILEDGEATVIAGGDAVGYYGGADVGIAPGVRARSAWDIDGDASVDLIGLAADGAVVWQPGLK